MSHFSKGGIENDPEGHARLKEILQGRNVRSRAGGLAKAKPSLEARFGVARDRDTSSDHLRLVSVDNTTP